MRNKRKIKLNTVNIFKYCDFLSGINSAANLYDIRLAIDAIRVPRPPILTPIRSSNHLSVNPESSKADGTLLIIWLEITAVNTSFPDIKALIKC